MDQNSNWSKEDFYQINIIHSFWEMECTFHQSPKSNVQHLKFAPIIVHTFSYQVITQHGPLHSIALSLCLKCKPIKKLGQTGQEISQSSKQVQIPLSQGPRVGPTCSHDLGIYFKCFGQGLDVQKSSVSAQSVRNPKSQLLVNCPFNQ